MVLRAATACVLALLWQACGEPMETPMVDGGPPMGDDGGASDFDPSITYPGEGDACEFSLFCADKQICVDGECQRHERFAVEDLEMGNPVRVPHEQLRASPIYTGARWDWDEPVRYTDGMLWGGLVPGPDGPAVLAWYEGERCQVLVYGAGPPRVVAQDQIECTAAGLSPDGYVLIGGVDHPEGTPDDPARVGLFDPSGALVTYASYPSEIYEAVARELGDPNIRLFHMTSVLWDDENEQFLFSAATGLQAEDREELPHLIPNRASHTFFGTVSLTGEIALHRVQGAAAHEGGRGWLVRDRDGIHSIFARYELLMLDGPFIRAEGDTLVELMSWTTGEREVLLHGMDGNAASGRYFQPEVDRWALTAFEHPDRCTARLFEGRTSVGDFEFAHDVCTSLYPDLEVGKGFAEPRGPAVTGHPLRDWVVTTSPEDDPTAWNLEAFEEGLVATFEGVTTYQHSFWAVSRYRKTFELLSIVYDGTDPMPVGDLVLFEAPLTRRSM